MGQGEVGGVTHMVLCTWQLLGLATCKRAMVDTKWANSWPSYSRLLRGQFLAGKVAWALSRYLPTENADYCILSVLF